MPSMAKKKDNRQKEPAQDLSTREFSLRKETDGHPSTLDREKRTVDVVMTTEDPVPVYDWDLGSIGEVLLMSGLKLPSSRQVPLQDTHDRYSVRSTLGSARSMRIEGDEAHATVHFSSTKDADDAFIKTDEGHITDFSVGYRVFKAVRIPKNESQIIGGKTFTGPLRVVTSWSIKELSIVPIGADERAKVRGAEYIDNTEDTMKKELKDLLEQRGLKKGASDDEAYAFLELLGGSRNATDDDSLTFLRSAGQADSQRASAETAGSDTQRAAGINQAEVAQVVIQVMDQRDSAARKRSDDITALCLRAGCQDQAAALIASGKTVDECRAAVLENIITSHGSRGLTMPAGSASFGADAKDKYRDAVSYSLIKRAGLKVKDLQDAPGHEDFRGYTMAELARHSLVIAGQRSDGDKMEMVGRAMTASDFPSILANVANKSLFAGFDEAEETFEAWTGVMSASDFKALNIPSISSLDDLLPIGSHGEYQYGYMRDKNERVTLGTAGRIYPITRTAIVNDDLNAITALFAGAGKKAKQYEGDLVYALLTSNPLMLEDGLNLFVAGHNNLAAVIGAPSNATMDDMDALFGAQTDQNGKTLNIPIKFVLMPRGMRGSAESFFKTIQFVNLAGDRLDNIWGGDVVGRIYEPRLNAAPATWYAAGPKGMTVVRVYLNGVQAPYTEQKEGWTVDGVELKVRHDVAAGLVDWRGLGRNP